MKDKNVTYQYQRGQVALFTVMLFLFVSLVVLAGFVALGTSQLRAANELIKGKKALFTSSSAAEDMTYRALGSNGAMNYTDALGQKKIKVRLNDGEASADLTLDGWTAQAPESYPKKFEVVAVGNVSARYRNAKLNFEIPDKKLAVGMQGAVQAGYLGVYLQGQNPQVIGTAGYGKGHVFSNGSIISPGGRPIINGNATVAKHIGDIPSQQHNGSNLGTSSDLPDGTLISQATYDSTYCGGTSACRFQFYKDPNRIVAQSFIADKTAKPLQVRVWLRKIGAPNNIRLNIVKNRRVQKTTGYPACTTLVHELSPGCFDIPDNSAGGVVAYSTIIENNVSTSFSFIGVSFPETGAGSASEALIMNEKYWIVIESACSSGGCLSGAANYYEVGGLDDNYEYGLDVDNQVNTYYKCNVDHLTNYYNGVGLCPPGDKGKLYVYTGINANKDYKAPPQPYSSLYSPNKDLAFKVYLGEIQTKISALPMRGITGQNPGTSLASGDQLEIIGNALAEYLEAIDVGGIAYFKNIAITNPPSTTDNEVKAGADYSITGDPNNPITFLGDAHAITKNNPTQNPSYIDQHSDLPIPPVGGICPTSSPTHPEWTKPGNAEGDLGCWVPRYSSDARRHCFNAYCSCSNGEQRDGAFCKDLDNPSPPAPAPQLPQIPDPAEAFGLKGENMSFDALQLRQKFAASMGLVDPANTTSGFYPYNDILTLGSPTNQTPVTATMPGSIPFSMLILDPVPVTRSFPYAVIDGSLVLQNAARVVLTGLKGGVCPYDNSTNPCYVLWVRGDLTLKDNAEITLAPPAGAPADFIASFYVLVDGKVSITEAAKVTPLAGNEANAATIVSYSGLTTDPYAIRLNSSAGGKGSVFFAYRGAISVLQSFEAKALAGQQIRLDGDTVIVKFDEGLKTPSNDRGGTQKLGADIKAYFEKK